MMMLKGLLAVLVVIHQVLNVGGHGRVVDPPSRASMWRYGFDTVPDYNDNQCFCGGRQYQIDNNGKCGVCGDPWNVTNKPHEAGGIYASGIIVKSYEVGQTILVMIQITANHKGYFEFRMCVNNDVKKKVTHECLDNNVLQLADGSGTKYTLDELTGFISIAVKLPENVVCTQCVLQWKYHVGNSWGLCEDGTGAIGCGPQEEFYACSDIAITGDADPDSNEPGTTSLHPVSHSTAAQTTVTNTVPIVPTTAPSNDGHEPGTTSPDTIDDSTAAQTTVPNTVPIVPTTAPSNDGQCHAIGIFMGNPDIDSWCVNNCALGNCPHDMCSCEPGEEEQLTVECISHGVHESFQMDTWCKNNCQLGHCPSSHCTCTK